MFSGGVVSQRFEFRVRQGDKRGAVRRQRSSEFADVEPHLYEQFDVLVGPFTAHRLDVELLQSFLDSLECRGVCA